MMELILVFTCVFVNHVKAQVNHVLNGSFENYSRCPLGPDQIRCANFWSQIDTSILDPFCSPEYCNECAGTNNFTGVPSSSFYFQYPRTGKGMAHVQMYFDESFSFQLKRDYLQGRLNSVLTGGTSYCVTFYVNLTERSRYAINNIGAFLDGGGIDIGQDSLGCASPQTSFTPQILETSIINDTLNWVKVQGNFTASGNETYITMGNFFDKAHTSSVALPYSTSVVSWYLIDDVSVIESTEIAHAGNDTIIVNGEGIGNVHIGTYEDGLPCTWYKLGDTTPLGYGGGIFVSTDSSGSYVVELNLCGHVTYDTMKVIVRPAREINIYKNLANVTIYPNPTKTSFAAENVLGLQLTFYDMLGREVKRKFCQNNKELVDVSALPKGIYILQFNADKTGEKIIRKLIKE